MDFMDKIQKDVENKIREDYEKELEGHPCPEHGTVATLKPKPDGFGIISCCEAQNDFVHLFLQAKNSP